MNKILTMFLIYCLTITSVMAGLPPTTAKGIGDSANKTTFNFQFPNTYVTHSGVTTVFGAGISTTTKNALTPSEGFTVFDTTLHAPSWYDGTNWQTGLGTITVDTDPVTYTATLAGTTSAPTLGTNTNTSSWYRHGKYMHITYTLDQTAAGSAGSGAYLIPLPSGYTIDTTYVTLDSTLAATTIGTGTILGSGWVHDTTSGNSTTTTECHSVAYSTTQIGVVCNDQAGSSAKMNPWGSSSYNLGNTTVRATVEADVPISGWSSNASTYSASNQNFDSVSVAATVTGTTTNPTKGTNSVDKFQYSRSGERLFWSWTYNQTAAGSAGSGTILITIPNSYAADTNKITADTVHGSVIGYGTISNASAGRADITQHAEVYLYDSTHFAIKLLGQASATNTYSTWTDASGSNFGSTNLKIQLEGFVPISGWSNVSQIVGSLQALSDIATISYTVSSGTNGGSATSAAWNDRPLNTIDSDLNAIVTSLSSNTVTLPAGTYQLNANAMTNNTNKARLRWRNTADSTTPCQGVNSSDEVVNASTPSITGCIFTITASKTFKLQQWVTTNSGATALGRPVSSGDSEVYAQVSIRRLK